MRLRLVGSQIIDVVEHQEQGLRIGEGVIGRAEDALVGFAAAPTVRRLEIEIVIAADVPPRQADGADDTVVALVEREIVEHDVAGRDAEFRVGVLKRGNNVLADEVDFGVGLGLRVSEHHDLEGLRLLLPREGEIDGGGQGARRGDAFEGQPKVLRGAVRLMQISDGRQVRGRGHWRHVTRWLDDEDHPFVADRETVSAFGVGLDDVDPIRDEDIRDAGIGRAGLAGAVLVFEHASGCGRSGGGGDRGDYRGDACHGGEQGLAAGQSELAVSAHGFGSVIAL